MTSKFRSLLCIIPLLISPVAYTQNRIAIPSYQDPGSPQWNAWSAVGSASVGIMIVNENNGDDTSYQPSLPKPIRQARSKGIFVVGYVYTGYGKRDPAIVRNRVDAVYKNYLVDGIFFDEVPTDCLAGNPHGGTNYSYYQKLSEYIRARQVGGRLVILNPGTQPANDCWMSIANILVTAESSSLACTMNYVDQPWFHNYGPSRFWHIVYNAPGADQLQHIFTLSQQRGAGWLYVTDEGNNGSNPYAGPPAYWRAEAALVANEDIQAPYATARPASIDEQGNSVPAKMSFRWKAVRGTHWQIAIANASGNEVSDTDFDAKECIDVEADGSVHVSVNSDGGWHPADLDAVAFQLDAHTHLVDFDSRGLGSAVKYRIRSFDASGTALSTTSSIPFSLNNRDYVFDIQDH